MTVGQSQDSLTNLIHTGAIIKNSGFLFPYDKRATVNLAPADIRKAGPNFDLPLAVGLLVAHDPRSREMRSSAITKSTSTEDVFR